MTGAITGDKGKLSPVSSGPGLADHRYRKTKGLVAEGSRAVLSRPSTLERWVMHFICSLSPAVALTFAVCFAGCGGCGGCGHVLPGATPLVSPRVRYLILLPPPSGKRSEPLQLYMLHDDRG